MSVHMHVVGPRKELNSYQNGTIFFVILTGDILAHLGPYNVDFFLTLVRDDFIFCLNEKWNFVTGQFAAISRGYICLPLR